MGKHWEKTVNEIKLYLKSFKSNGKGVVPPCFACWKVALAFFLFSLVILFVVQRHKIDEPYWFLEFVKIAVPISIAGLTLFIALRQYYISQEQKELAAHKLRLDLFEERFAVYKAVQNLIGAMYKHEYYHVDEFEKTRVNLFFEAEGYVFIMPDTIITAISDVFTRALTISTHYIRLKGIDTVKDEVYKKTMRDEAADYERELIIWLQIASLKMKELFMPLLDFKKIQ